MQTRFWSSIFAKPLKIRLWRISNQFFRIWTLKCPLQTVKVSGFHLFYIQSCKFFFRSTFSRQEKSLLRILLKISSAKPYKIIEMHRGDFKDYRSCNSAFNYKVISFSKVKALTFSNSFTEITPMTKLGKVAIRPLQKTSTLNVPKVRK